MTVPLLFPGKTQAEVNRLREIFVKYPHAREYITPDGLLRASQDTLEMWEYEATLCEKVINAVGGVQCPRCQQRFFQIQEGIIVNFGVPFTHGARIQVYGQISIGRPLGGQVRCAICRREFPRPNPFVLLQAWIQFWQGVENGETHR